MNANKKTFYFINNEVVFNNKHITDIHWFIERKRRNMNNNKKKDNAVTMCLGGFFWYIN